MRDLNLNNEGVQELMNMEKKELIEKLITSEFNYKKERLTYKEEKAQAEWLDILADSLRDEDEETEQQAEELYEDYKKVKRENEKKLQVMKVNYELNFY